MTIQSVNYGNRLQNYALQTVLDGMGHHAEALLRRPGVAAGTPKQRLRAVKREAGLALKHRSDRRGAFAGFDKDFISFSGKVVSKDFVSTGVGDSYDCFVIGSDQVWNPDFDFNSEVEYLPMVPADKKVSYAASFGVSEITENRARTAELLDGIKCVSVRESAGANIVRDLTGRKVPVVLDPTLLLGPDDWKRVSKKPAKVDCDSPFVFKYMLGNDVNERRIGQMAQDRGLAIVDVMDPSLAIGPSEFVWLIAHSELVCTDSFHASVFALLHHKPLAIFERDSADADMSSRFDTLCSSFGLEGHRSSEESFGDDAVFGTDWEAFETRLKGLRADSLEWLESAIGGVALG